MVSLLPLTIACPQCGSQDVVYSCEPDCCFNHVCGTCYTSFELVTTLVGEQPGTLDTPQADRDSCAPTVACARCESIEVCLLDTGETPPRLICLSCHALLALGFSEVSPRA